MSFPLINIQLHTETTILSIDVCLFSTSYVVMRAIRLVILQKQGQKPPLGSPRGYKYPN